MDDVRLANYFAGIETEAGPIEAWRVDRDIAIALSVREGTVVWLSYYNFSKTVLSHRDITFSEFKRVPSICGTGFAFRARRRTVEIVYVSGERPIKAVLKATAINEVYLKTLHRIHWKEARRLYRKATESRSLVRDVKAELARHLQRRAKSA